MYVAISYLHLSCVVLSFALFNLRLGWMFLDSPLLRRRWVRLLPHVIDTLLLIAGVALAVQLGQYPLLDAWLTAKLLGLLAYIVLGSLALKRAPTRRARLLATIGAWLAFAFIVAAALTRSPLPWV